jgi:hypothetical protein
MKILFLDDSLDRWAEFKDNNPQSDAMWAIKYDSAVGLIEQNNKFDLMFLDCELNDKYSGEDFVNYLIINKIKIDKIVCHSMDYSCRKEMTSVLHENGYNVINFPLVWEYTIPFILEQFTKSSSGFSDNNHNTIK